MSLNYAATYKKNVITWAFNVSLSLDRKNGTMLKIILHVVITNKVPLHFTSLSFGTDLWPRGYITIDLAQTRPALGRRPGFTVQLTEQLLAAVVKRQTLWPTHAFCGTFHQAVPPYRMVGGIS